MRYWVFTEEQLQAAATAWATARIARSGNQIEGATAAGLVIEFLCSPEAIRHKLQGGAAYEPEGGA